MVRQAIGRFYYSGRGPEGMYMYDMVSEKNNPLVRTYFAVHFPTKDFSSKIQRIELDPNHPEIYKLPTHLWEMCLQGQDWLPHIKGKEQKKSGRFYQKKMGKMEK